ncbi:MAG: bestrophin family protein [Myxococcaceae bacterium]
MIDYDAHSWREHLLDWRGSMLPQIGYRIGAVVLWAACVVWAFKSGHLVAVPTTIHVLIGFALGLLLVFRTNASYDRFWEGRRLWGGMVNETRNLARQSQQWIAPTQPDLHRQLLQWLSAFAYASMHALRGTSGLGPVAAGLDASVLGQVTSAAHAPSAVAAKLSGILAQARRQDAFSDVAQVAMDQNIQLLVDYIGGCERIHKTPLPFAYVVHLRRALILYCFSLPFALVREFGWLTIPEVLGVAYVFFGIEEIGVQIEDPFGVDDNDLPLEQICENISRGIQVFA